MKVIRQLMESQMNRKASLKLEATVFQSQLNQCVCVWINQRRERFESDELTMCEIMSD